MDWRYLPPMQALKAFAAYAQTGSVQAAGEALNVTHAAISQQIRNLEGFLGVELLDRSGRQARLTEPAEELARTLNQSFERMSEAALNIMTREAARPLVVATTPTFAAHWLIPRLAEFRALHPGIDIVFDARAELVDVAGGQADLAIRFGKGNWPSLDSKRLAQTRMCVVAAPELMPGGVVSCLEDLSQFALLHEVGASESTRWLERRGFSGVGNAGRVTLPGNLTLDAARAGQGIAVVATLWVQADLDAGRLVQLYEDPEEVGYYLLTPLSEPRPALKAFCKWALGHAG